MNVIQIKNGIVFVSDYSDEPLLFCIVIFSFMNVKMILKNGNYYFSSTVYLFENAQNGWISEIFPLVQ